jgi:hypothetical protein
MRTRHHTLEPALLAAIALTSMLAVAQAQNSVSLTATRQTALMPDGARVPMWGWACGTGTAAAAGATCTQTNGAAQTVPATGTSAVWQPPLIRVPAAAAPATTGLTITLTNTLPVATSLVIIGQIPQAADTGRLGAPVRESGRPQHPAQTATTWTIATPTDPANGPAPFQPPSQSARVRSFVAEAPPTTGTATYTFTNLRPGTYLIESGTYPAIQGPMGLYGVLVVTTAPATGAAGTAYPSPTGAVTATGVQYDADAVVLTSEIDPVQNAAVDAFLVRSAGCTAATGTCSGTVSAAAEMTKWTLACSTMGPAATANTCYPPAVDYTPLYYLIDGVAFDPANASASQLNIGSAATAASASTGVLLRLVNAGLRFHVPSVVGLQMFQMAEDGNLEPDVAVALTTGHYAQSATGVTFTQTTATATTPQPKLVTDVFLPAGKVIDALVFPGSAGTYAAASYALYDRELSLSANSTRRDNGMQAYLVVNGGAAGAGAGQTTGGALNAFATATAVADQYIVPAHATTFSGNVLTNDTGVHNASSPCVATTGSTGPQTVAAGAAGTVTLNPDGSFTLAVAPGFTNGATGSFTYCGNGNAALSTTATFYAARLGGAPTANADTYTSRVANLLQVAAPGVLVNDTDPAGFPLTAVVASAGTGGCTLSLQTNGAFTASLPALATPAARSCTFTYNAVNSQGTASASAATVTLNFPAASGLAVTVQDANTKTAITDYKWVIEQDLTFYLDPNCQQNGPGGTKPATCPSGVPPTLGTNFHMSYMPVIAAGCTGPQSCERGQSLYNPATGTHVPAVCDASGLCSAAAAGASRPASTPNQAVLNATNPDGTPARYYLSILPGDAANAFNTGNASDPTVAANCTPTQTPTGQTVSQCGHTMAGASIAAPTCTAAGACTFAPVTVNVQRNPMKTATLTVFVFEDDFPLNGEHDGNGAIEPGLGGFTVVLWDDAGSSGDPTGQMTYDMFNMPLSNSLNGTVDPLTGQNACPIAPTDQGNQVAVGVIIVCPQYEADGVTPSPLVGQAVITNLMPGRFSVIVHPGAARTAAGEEWLQTNTLDGTHLLDSFVRSGEPPYFQEYSPAGWHVFMGMANPAVINARKPGLCASLGASHCRNTVNVNVSNLHMSRPPNETLYDSAVFALGNGQNYQALNYTTCYASLGDRDGSDFAFAKCDQNGHLTFTGVPDGNWSLKVFDQWVDFLVDGSSKPVNVTGGQTLNVDYPTFTWQQHIWNNTYVDVNGNGIRDPGEPAIGQVPTRVRFRNGKFSNSLFTDADGNANFDETFPLFSWYVVESDTTRYRGTAVHVANDAGGKVDGPGPMGNGRNGSYQGILATCTQATPTSACAESFPLPTALRFPGSYYCSNGDCSERRGAAGPPPAGGPGGSTGRIDPGTVHSEGVQGFVSQFQVLDWGKMPYVPGENGGIRGHVVYGSTRPFDDPQQLFQNLWEPLVPNVTVNLYRESLAPDGTVALTLVDTTNSSSWDAYAQGFRAAGVPNMNCPGQDPAEPFFAYTLAGTANYLNPTLALPNNSQYKCYDGMHAWNQIQPAPYDGLWEFPSPTCRNTPAASFSVTSGPLAGQTIHCATVHNPAYGSTGPASVGGVVQSGAVAAVLPTGKYVVEVIPPRGYEIVKEEDKNILIGDNFIAPVTVNPQFAGLGDIFIVPDQATVNATYSWYGPNYANPSYTGPNTGGANPYNANGTPTGNNANPTTNMGRTGLGGFGPGGNIVMAAPCVGALRIVPDYMSISPESGEVAPFAGASRRLCDRREVTLEDQMQAQTDFFVWTKTPAAAHYTGFILDDFSSEFDPASPSFGEKFAVPNLPVSIKDFNGAEVSRTMSDQWGMFNGLTFSTWEVDPPNPTGYSPGMLITCMNDPGPILAPVCTTAPTATTAGFPPGCVTAQTTPPTMITDPWFNPQYSTFCYEWPFMPSDTTYLDTPVVPASAFAEGYNPPDCGYPDGTPAIKSVNGTGVGPWVSAAGGAITITALGDQIVANHAYSGPAANTAPYNQKFITRHYGFGTTRGTVTIGGITATTGTWNDTTITAAVPAGLPVCAGHWASTMTAAQATAKYGNCGELVITKPATAGNPLTRRSIDAVTVTVGGKAPTHVNGENAAGNALQSAINAAASGDLIIVGPGTYPELVIMWKPVRLQGVGAPSVVIDGNAHPAGKLNAWRRQVDCLFGVTLSGALIAGDPTATPPTPPRPYDPTGTYTCSAAMQGQVDPIPLEPLIGWNTDLNGNLAELLQEPTLMGAYEGAGITVVGKGLENPNTTNCSATSNAACVPVNDSTDCKYVSNFKCNPASIDGFTVRNSSQGGGAILLHGWNHYMTVANNRVTNNAGTLTGGIGIGLAENAELTNVTSGTGASTITVAQPLLQNTYVSVHNNAISLNSAYGDEVNSTTPAAAGGVTFCSGADFYDFAYNWVCGNLSTGDGGGFSHFGFSYNGTIEHNAFLFNQSNNPTLTTWGGGVQVTGPAVDGDVGETSLLDVDVAPALTDGAGPNLRILSNLFQGNTAESGSGGGLRLQMVNGNDVLNNPSHPEQWYAVTVRNNIFANNVAGWAGGGVSIQDAVKVTFDQNTVASNDATATAGVLFDTLSAANSSVPPPACNPNTGAGCANPVTNSSNQPAGFETHRHTLQFAAAIAGATSCGGFDTTPASLACRTFSVPSLTSDVFWQNRAFHITVGGGAMPVIQLTPALTQSTTGACPSGATYWDIGVQGDTGPTNHSSGLTLQPTAGSNVGTGGYPGASANPSFTSQYCNGSRVPPEIAPLLCTSNANAPGCIQPGTVGVSMTAPAGVPDNNPFYAAFTLNPAATVDEGNNWINMFYGPLSTVNPVTARGATGYSAPLGNYSVNAGPGGAEGNIPW